MRFDPRRTIRLVNSNLSANFCIMRDFDVAGSHHSGPAGIMRPETAFRFDLNQTENAAEAHSRRTGLVFDP
jgi:hypothetical protein